MTDFQTILYEQPADSVARIVLNRPDTRNAQDTRMLYELNDAFDRAAQDDGVKVIILAANGPHFSAGHDLRETDTYQKMREHRTVGTWCGFTCAAPRRRWRARRRSTSASASAGATCPSRPSRPCRGGAWRAASC